MSKTSQRAAQSKKDREAKQPNGTTYSVKLSANGQLLDSAGVMSQVLASLAPLQTGKKDIHSQSDLFTAMQPAAMQITTDIYANNGKEDIQNFFGQLKRMHKVLHSKLDASSDVQKVLFVMALDVLKQTYDHVENMRGMLTNPDKMKVNFVCGQMIFSCK